MGYEHGCLGGSVGTDYNSDVSVCWGDSQEFCIEHSTDDANANALYVKMPDGDATDVPVMVYGLSSVIDGTDLGVFDGITKPTIAVYDSSSNYFYVGSNALGTNTTFTFANATTQSTFAVNPPGGFIFVSPSVTSGGGTMMEQNVDITLSSATYNLWKPNFTVTNSGTAGFRGIHMRVINISEGSGPNDLLYADCLDGGFQMAFRVSTDFGVYIREDDGNLDVDAAGVMKVAQDNATEVQVGAPTLVQDRDVIRYAYYIGSD